MLFGAVVGAPVWILATLWLTRRAWHNARRLAARAKGHDHLVELGHLAGGLAHEIKNPLSTISLNLRLLSEDLSHYDDDEHRRWLRRLHSVQGEANRLKAILDDFLRYAGRYELSLKPEDLRQVVGDVVDFFAPQADAARVVMRASMPETPIRCLVDANLIKQALLNLMINSVQAMEGGGELILRVSARRANAVIEVIDTGPGVALADAEKIFQVYYSTKRGGTGLGLPTARRIVREHNGTLRVESEPGRGTLFVISLPLDRGGRGMPPADPEAPQDAKR
jgi:signal transduction histidine kinase